MEPRRRAGPCLLPPLVTPPRSSQSLNRVASAPSFPRSSKGFLLGGSVPPGALAAEWSRQLPPSTDSEAAAIVCSHLSSVNACLRSLEPRQLEDALREANGQNYLRTIAALRRSRSVTGVQRHALESALATHIIKARTILRDWKPGTHRDISAKRQSRSTKGLHASAEASHKKNGKDGQQAAPRKASHRETAAGRQALGSERAPDPEGAQVSGGRSKSTVDTEEAKNRAAVASGAFGTQGELDGSKAAADAEEFEEDSDDLGDTHKPERHRESAGSVKQELRDAVSLDGGAVRGVMDDRPFADVRGEDRQSIKGATGDQHAGSEAPGGLMQEVLSTDAAATGGRPTGGAVTEGPRRHASSERLLGKDYTMSFEADPEGSPPSQPGLRQKDYTMAFEADPEEAPPSQPGLRQKDYTMTFEADPQEQPPSQPGLPRRDYTITFEADPGEQSSSSQQAPQQQDSSATFEENAQEQPTSEPDSRQNAYTMTFEADPQEQPPSQP
eukprot:CAMPEP_0179050938 /NCGR_PEP_ID=MMETSP0796-20121207/20990_1 /TAXON_ID=73915 /ORGANISM="Pyrodinium bahamense, Strain pbaha01" /LENGTH=499 /DNA_ID=CAMNT_0020747469 /DNA_START=70 /DNA_END=1565 /DNA_ORIENTATION=+